MKLKCNLCHANIIVEREQYIHLEDWDKNKLTSELWSHLVCYNNAINIQTQGKRIFDKIETQLNKMMGIQKTYQIE